MTHATPLRHALYEVAHGRALSAEQAGAAFDALMRGEATAVEMAALLMGLRIKGETAEEVAGAAAALRRAMVGVELGGAKAVDTCGTGGGQVGTLNVSTAAAFVAAGAGVPVAKHGNRSHTSRSGSADVLEALGVDIALPPARAPEVFRAAGLVFLYAPTYHPAMRHVGPVRRELGVATIMNLLGPLANPAGVSRQVIGVSDAHRAPVLAEALLRLGAEHALVLHADVGMDEISPCGQTDVWEVRDGAVTRWRVEPAHYGLACDELDQLAGAEPEENARRIEELLAGKGNSAERCAVLLNAAAALYVAGTADTFGRATELAEAALRDGAAHAALERLRRAAPRAVSTSG
ncbi:MAG TPA: anthranilate phosphoribosyltransferase [Gemmatimonadales bacterium]|nr:anthranilate phosphoribosyltransferase [Gemmatimonadales bacterium]